MILIIQKHGCQKLIVIIFFKKWIKSAVFDDNENKNDDKNYHFNSINWKSSDHYEVLWISIINILIYHMLYETTMFRNKY